MTVNHLWTATREYEITGVGYAPEGQIEAEGRSWRAVDDADLELLLEGGMLCGNARLAEPEGEGSIEVYGDPTEACLIVSAQKGGIDRAELEARMPRVKELPFESRRKRMTTVHALEYPLDGARRIAFTKGAPNEVVRLSTHVRVNGVVGAHERGAPPSHHGGKRHVCRRRPARACGGVPPARTARTRRRVSPMP